MIITVICDVLGKLNNGTTIAATNLINSLREKGHEVRVVCPDEDKKNLPGYYVVPKRNFGYIINKIIERNGVLLAKPDYGILRQALEGADVMHLVTPYALSQAALEIACEKNMPVTASFHSQAENFTSHIFLMKCKIANYIVYKRYYDKVFRYCDIIHYPTAFIKDEFEGIITKTNAVVISNGVNEEFYRQAEGKRISEKFTIVCTGRYSKEKDPTTLLKAVNASKYKNNIKIFLAGDGPLKEKLKKLTEKYSLDVDFGFLSRKDLISLMRGADLYVHTAKAEIEAIACMEAIVSGLVPVICNSPKSATRMFALDENNLFKKDSVADLTKKIEFWYENEKLKEEYKNRYISMTTTFDQSECMAKMEKMMYEAVEMHGTEKTENEENILLRRRA